MADIANESSQVATTASTETCVNCNNPQEHSEHANASGQQTDNTFSISIKLPHHPYSTQTIISPQDQAQDVRQSIIDLPHTFQYSCFHLESDGQRVPDFVDLGEVPGIKPDAQLTLVEDAYTEKDARLHLLRIRDLIGVAGDRTDLVHGIEAGTSLYDHLAQANNTSTSNGTDTGIETTPLSGYDIDVAGSFDTLLPRSEGVRPKTVKSLSLSPWNPPPYHLRSKGHLLYLQVTTNEGEQHQITSHVSGFYINKSSNSKFDPLPRPSPKSHHAHSLLTLLSRISPSFDSAFKSLQEFTGRRDPLSSFQLSNAIPASPWIVSPSTTYLQSHLPDMCRTQESYLLSGSENTETLRDWNEEFQTTRELPRETVQDRVFRERVMNKLFADYNEAATQGAVLIARGEVAPLNPTEGRDAQIFVYNNIFFSFGADGVGTFANEGGDEAARVATGKDVNGVKSVNQLDIQGLSSPATVVVDYLGKRLVGQSIVPGIFKQREPGEHQIDYGGVEGKDIIAENEVFTPLFKKLSTALKVKKHPVWDKESKRHDLEGSIETKGLIGTDGRHYVLDLYRITPLDVSWVEKYWIEPSPSDIEEKQPIKGYPHRMTVLRPELIDTYWRIKLREFVKEEMAKAAAHDKKKLNGSDAAAVNGENDSKPKEEDATAVAEQAVEDGDQDTKKNSEQEKVDISGFQYALNPDVFSGQQPQTVEEKEEWAKDEAEVRTVCSYLHSEVMPRLIQDLKEGDIGFPMDGESLTNLLHKRGINIRYLGRIAELSDQQQPRMKALRQLATQEMVARAFKHIASYRLRYLPSAFTSTCAAHMLNCLIGFELNKSPKANTDEDMKMLYPEVSFEYEQVTPQSLQTEIEAEVALRYRHNLDPGWVKEIKPIQMLREVSLKLGFQLQAKEYAFSNTAISSNGTSSESEDINSSSLNGQSTNGGKKKKKGGDNQSPINGTATPPPMPVQTFQPDDIENIVPVIKESSPRSVLAEEALEAGRISVAQNQKELGQELLLESLSLHEQIYGILHAEVARVYYQLSSLFYGLDDKNIAVELARKAVIVSERTLGVDNNETVLSYLNLGLFEHAVGNTRAALGFIRHALDLWKIVYGPKHPDSMTTVNNAAVMLQHLKLYRDSRHWFEASLNICQEVSGANSVATATLLFQLAQALALDQEAKAAVTRMREAYNIFHAELGANDRNTKEAETWLEQLTQNAVSIAKHAKDLQARKMRRLNQLTPRVGLGTRPQPQVGQSEQDALRVTSGLPNAATSGDTRGIAPATAAGASGLGRLDERSIDELLKYIEGGDASKGSSGGTKKQPGTANPKRRQQKVST